MATCPNGHANPVGQHFCGECGTPLVASNPARVAQPPRANANELRRGGSVKVVAPGDDHDGRLGTIYELLDDDSGVCVKFSGDSEPYAFGRDELEAVPTPRHKPTVSKASGSSNRSASKPHQQPPTPGWYPDPAGGPIRKYWDETRWYDAIPAPVKPPGRVNWPGLIAVGVGLVVVLIVVASLIGELTSGTDKTPPGSYPDNWECVDITPKKDGGCLVDRGGLFSTGLMAGWIRSAGVRPGSRSCMWERLSGPDPAEIKMIIEAGGIVDANTGETTVHIEKTDYAFWSKGCQPWQRMSDE